MTVTIVLEVTISAVVTIYSARSFRAHSFNILPPSVLHAVRAGKKANSGYKYEHCDRPSRSRFSVVFLGPRANAESVPKFHVALHASHAALPTVTLKFRPNVALLMSVCIPF
jgi:hypothetical protein